jgi:hypothetical protein
MRDSIEIKGVSLPPNLVVVRDHLAAESSSNFLSAGFRTFGVRRGCSLGNSDWTPYEIPGKPPALGDKTHNNPWFSWKIMENHLLSMIISM